MTTPNVKACALCKVEQPIGAFRLVGGKRRLRGLRRSRCSACERTYRVAYDKANVGRLHAIKFRSTLRGYGMTVQSFGEMVERQSGGCAICGSLLVRSQPGRRSKMQAFHIDHDHATGRVRGILCGYCNVGIGMFKDDSERLSKAAAYLKASRWMRAS